MKKLVIGLLIGFFFINLVSAIRINEIELNPKDDCRDCTEWIEFFSDEEINLDGWKIVDKGGNIFYLENISFKDYYVVTCTEISLNNKDEIIYLYNGDNLVDKSPEISDSSNNNKSWQFCNDEWIFEVSTKGDKNDCPEEESEEIIEEEEEPEVDEEVEPEDEEEQEEEEVKKEIIGETKKGIIIQTTTQTGNVIKLGNRESILDYEFDNPENIYESATEKIKKYGIYGFCLFLIMVIIFLLFKIRKFKNQII